jgi:hypothetical protein
MATSSDKNPSERKDPEEDCMIDDDETVIAETQATTNDFIEEEMTDLKVRYEIPHRNGKSHGDDFKLHVQLLEAITKIFDKNTVRIYDNKNVRVKSFSERKWLNKEYYEDHFNIHDEKGQRNTVIIHRIMSRKSISDIKHEPAVIALLKKSSTYLRAHFWSEDEASLKDIGFLLDYVPTKHSKEFVSQDIYKRCRETPELEWSHAPKFELIHAQPRMKLDGRKNPIKTHAFSVQVVTKNASIMSKFLQKIYDEDHLYIPYSMKKQFPKAVAAAILKQNKLLKNTWVIVIIGIPRAIMTELESKILATSGVTGISDTNRTDRSGKWNILVKEADFKSIRKRLASNIQKWVHELPPDVQALIPDSFPPPKVHQKNGFDDDDDDDSSYGQASYMSSCAQSYASFDDDTDEQFHDPPGANNRMSYAAAVSGATYPSSATTPPYHTSPAPPSQAPPSNVEITEFRSVIANLQQDVTIAQLQNEIQSLKAQLKGALTPSTITESSTPIPTGTQDADRMAAIEASMSTMTTEFTKWMHEVRKIVTTEPSDSGTKHSIDDPSSQQSKRADTRTTPLRNAPMDIDESRAQLFPAQEQTHTDHTTRLPSDVTPNSPSPSPDTLLNTPPRARCKSPTPSTPETSPFQSMASLLKANASPTYPIDYDFDNPRYVYQENETGTLDCIGLAQPSDFDADGNLRGPQPTQHDNRIAMMLLRRAFSTAPNRTNDRPTSPVETLATQDETTTSSNQSSPTQGQPSPTPRATPRDGLPPKSPRRGSTN